ncbi:MAG: ATP-binding cassette domain-containing protein [Bdellovibrionales bacterium]
MINVSGLSKAYSGRELFSDISFTLGKNEVLGLVGRNGCGKSTMTKIILKLEDADEGTVTSPRGYVVGHLDQHIKFTEKTLVEEACTALPPERSLETYLAEKALFGLGFTQEDLQKDPYVFSGGYQLRINLAKCLLSEPNLLILDEPTNYLDILSINWMKSVIKKYKGEVIIITHDKEFMNSVVTHTGGIHRGNFKKIKGNTDKYYEQLLLEEEIFEKTRLNQVKKKQELEKFVERFGAKASKAAQAQSKMKQINKMEILDKLDGEENLGFRFTHSKTPAKILMRVENLNFGFDEPLIKDLNFEIKNGDRIGIIGKNGKGKTTLLNLLYGEFGIPEGSKLTTHPDCDINYYQQTNRKNLDPNLTIHEEISAENPRLSLTQSHQICGAMMFPGDDAKKKIKVLSGGEQSRVLLGKVIATSCNVLFLDEPTNHLDLESIESLIQEVSKFPGPVVFVTHSEEFLKRVATKLIYFKEGKTVFFDDDYKEFLDKVGWDDGPVKKKEAKAIKHVSNAKRLRPLERDIEKLEGRISNLEAKIKENNDSLTGDWKQDETAYANIKKHQAKMEEYFSSLERKSAELETLKNS